MKLDLFCTPLLAAGSFLHEEDCIASPNISGRERFSAEVSAESSLKVVFIERGKGKTTSLF